MPTLTDKDIVEFDAQQTKPLTDADITQFDSQSNKALTDDDIMKFDSQQKTLTDDDIVQFDRKSTIQSYLDEPNPETDTPTDIENPLQRDRAETLTQMKYAQKLQMEHDPIDRLLYSVGLPFDRLLRHPISTIATAWQEKGKIEKEDVMSALSSMTFKRPANEKSYGDIWENWWKTVTGEEKAPEWYKAMGELGTSLVVEIPALKGIAKGATKATKYIKTRPATEQEAKFLQELVKPIKKGLQESGVNIKGLNPKGNALSIQPVSGQTTRMISLNEFQTSVLTGDKIRVPRSFKMPDPTVVAKVEQASKSNLPVSIKALSVPVNPEDVATIDKAIAFTQAGKATDVMALGDSTAPKPIDLSLQGETEKEVASQIKKPIEKIKQEDIAGEGFGKGIKGEQDLTFEETKLAVYQNKNTEILNAIKNEVQEGEAGYRMSLKDDEGYSISSIGVKSSFPSYFKNKGLTKKYVINAIDKAINGDKLSVKQEQILNDLILNKRAILAEQAYDIRKKNLHIENIPDWVSENSPTDIIPPEISESIQKIDEAVDSFAFADQSGFVTTEPFAKAASAMKSAYDWTFTFGEARRTNPALYNKLMSSFAKRNAGIEKAISKVDVIMGKTLMTPEDDVLLTEAYEDMRVAVPERLIDLHDKFSDINNKISQATKDRGIFTGSFQERMIAENEAKIERIKKEVKHPDKSKRIKQLMKEIEDFKNMRYLPHQTVAQHAIEAKINSIQNRDERSAYIEKASRISAKFKQRKGRGFLKDYLESGLLEPSDIGIRKLTMDNVISYYRRSAMADIFDFAKDQGLVKPSTEALKLEGWYNARELGITSPELKEKLVHPLLADALVEMKEMQMGKRGGAIRQMLGIVKVAQFIKPQIIFIYDAFQSLMRGMYSLNPIKEAKFIAKSTRSVLNQSKDYHEMNTMNLFQFPYETPKAARDEMIKMAVNQTQTDIPTWKKKLEKITNMSWDNVSAMDILASPYRAMANATWFGDKIQRMTSVYSLEDMGYSREEAVKIASRGHAAYSELSLKFKKTMSPIVFVHSFRVLMPMEMIKVVTEPVVGVINSYTKGKKIPKREKVRWAKAILGTLAIPIIADMYLRSRGFESDKLGWKWKKKVKDAQGKEHEIIVGVNNIINIPLKYWHRFTAYNPIDSSTRGVQGIKNFFKWELHPVWRLFFWDIAKNRKSFGSGENVYDPNDHWVSQSGQIMKYSFGQMFRLYGQMMDAAEAGNITTKEMKENEALMKQALTGLDRTLLGIFGYKYVRKDKKERQFIMQKVLKSEFHSRKWQIAKKYEGENQAKRYEKLKKWYERCNYWIKNDMD